MTSDVEVEVQQSFRVVHDLHGRPAPSVHERAEAVMAVLVELSECGVILDSAVSADTSHDSVTIEVTVKVEDLADGVSRGLTAMRNAIHKVGDATPNWPLHKDVLEMIGETVRAEVVSA